MYPRLRTAPGPRRRRDARSSCCASSHMPMVIAGGGALPRRRRGGDRRARRAARLPDRDDAHRQGDHLRDPSDVRRRRRPVRRADGQRQHGGRRLRHLHRLQDRPDDHAQLDAAVPRHAGRPHRRRSERGRAQLPQHDRRWSPTPSSARRRSSPRLRGQAATSNWDHDKIDAMREGLVGGPDRVQAAARRRRAQAAGHDAGVPQRDDRRRPVRVRREPRVGVDRRTLAGAHDRPALLRTARAWPASAGGCRRRSASPRRTARCRSSECGEPAAHVSSASPVTADGVTRWPRSRPPSAANCRSSPSCSTTARLGWIKHSAATRYPGEMVSQDFEDVSYADAAKALGAKATLVERSSPVRGGDEDGARRRRRGARGSSRRARATSRHPCSRHERVERARGTQGWLLIGRRLSTRNNYERRTQSMTARTERSWRHGRRGRGLRIDGRRRRRLRVLRRQPAIDDIGRLAATAVPPEPYTNVGRGAGRGAGTHIFRTLDQLLAEGRVVGRRHRPDRAVREAQGPRRPVLPDRDEQGLSRQGGTGGGDRPGRRIRARRSGGRGHRTRDRRRRGRWLVKCEPDEARSRRPRTASSARSSSPGRTPSRRSSRPIARAGLPEAARTPSGSGRAARSAPR